MDYYEKLKNYRNTHGGFPVSVGVVTTVVREGYTEGEMEIGPQHMNSRGTVHGGCIFTLADTIAGTAALTYGTHTTTTSAHVNFLRAATDTRYLKAVATAVKAGRTLLVFDTDITDDAGLLVANLSFTFFRFEKEYKVD